MFFILFKSGGNQGWQKVEEKRDVAGILSLDIA